jgi:hypothetical protein
MSATRFFFVLVALMRAPTKSFIDMMPSANNLSFDVGYLHATFLSVGASKDLRWVVKSK